MQMSWETHAGSISVCVSNGRLMSMSDLQSTTTSIWHQGTHTHGIYISYQYYIICTIYMWLVQPLMCEALTPHFHLSSSLSYYKINTSIFFVKIHPVYFPHLSCPVLQGSVRGAEQCSRQRVLPPQGLARCCALTAAFERHLLVTFC